MDSADRVSQSTSVMHKKQNRIIGQYKMTTVVSFQPRNVENTTTHLFIWQQAAAPRSYFLAILREASSRPHSISSTLDVACSVRPGASREERETVVSQPERY